MTVQGRGRRSIRLKGYDYAQPGACFVTICAQNRDCLSGDVAGDEMVLNDAGRMAQTEWEQLPERFPLVDLDAYVVMPNHLHGIVVIVDPVGVTRVPDPVGATLVVAPDVVTPGAGTSPAPTLGNIVGAFKSITTNVYIRGVRELGWPPFDRRLWQRNYHEHIVRDESELQRIRDYILANPAQWAEDDENPKWVAIWSGGQR